MTLYSKAVMLFESFFLSLYFTCLNFIKKTTLESDDGKIIVSLTSYPGRINSIYLTIESLFNQDFYDFKVFLYLSEEQFFERQLPLSLLRLIKRGLVVKFVKGDIRSYKKLHYSLKDFPNKVIVTADDDIIYPKNWLRTFHDFHVNHPRDILYARGHKITFTSSGEVGKYEEYTMPEPYAPLMNVIPTGVSGILYPPNSLYTDVLKTEVFMKYAPFADDIWYRVMGIMNGTNCRLIYQESVHFTPVIGTQFDSLRKRNLSSIGLNNDAQLKAVLQYYKLDLDETK